MTPFPITIAPTTLLGAAEAVCAGWWLVFDWRYFCWVWEPTPAELDLWVEQDFM